MKKFLFALAMIIFASALQQARGDDVSIDVFYDNLSGGNWIEVEGYGYGWQPDVAVNDSNWRPYADGYWAYTDYGWTWFPGSDLDWGPAWVSWRTGGDYVGWAPLPPRGVGVVYEGRPIGPQVDIEFDIGPEYYNFCEVRYIGEPVLRNYIAPPVQNITYINNTVNVTNITVKNNVVYNYGPNYEVLSAQSARPIQRLSIERQSAANFSAAAKSGALTKVQGNKLVVAAPAKLAKAPATAKPPTVKTKVAQPKINRGWAGVQNEAQLKQKIKTENPKNVPPPTGAAARRAGSPPPAAGASPAAPAAAGAPPVSPGPRGKPGRVPPGAKATPPGGPPAGISPSPFERGRGRPGGGRLGATMSPAGAPASVAPSPIERGKGRPGEPGGRPRPGTTTSPAGVPGEAAAPAFRASPPSTEHGGPPKGRPAVTPPGLGQPGGPAGMPEQGRGRKLETKPPGTPPPPAPGAYEGRRSGGEAGQPGLRKPTTPPPPGPRQGEAQGGRERGQGAYGQPGGQPRPGAPAAAARGQQQPERGKKKGEGTPPPRP